MNDDDLNVKTYTWPNFDLIIIQQKSKRMQIVIKY